MSATLTGAPARFEKGLTELAGGVWAWLQPNGAWGEANAGLIAGDGEALLIDTLWDERLAAEMLAAMRPALGGRAITTVVNTHSDGDHWWGNNAMPADAEIVTSATSRATMDSEAGPGELRRMRQMAQLTARVPGPMRAMGRYVSGMLGPFDFENVTLRRPGRVFSGEEPLEVDGRELRLIELGPAHTPGDLVVHLPGEGIVFAADTLFLGAIPVTFYGPVEGWIGALDTLLGFDAETYVPGHGPPGGREQVAGLRDYLTWLREIVAREHAAGRSPLEAARAALREDEFQRWSDWECPERIVIAVTTLHRALSGKDPIGPSPVGRARVFRDVGRLAGELG